MSRSDAQNDGITLYQQERCGDALKTFKQAPSQQSVKRVTRSDVNKDLDRLITTLRDFKNTVNLAPVASRNNGQSEPSTSSHGDKLRASLKIVDLALERVQPSDKKRRAELQTLREEICGSLRTLSIFDILPVEVQTHIFGFAVRRGDPGVLTLILVCRIWKELVIETPSLWRHFNLGYFATQRVVDARLKRARGIFTSLWINSGPWTGRKHHIFSKAPKDFWSRIEELEVGRSGRLSYLPAEAIPQLRLRRLIVNYYYGLEEEPWKDMNEFNASSVRDLAILGDIWCKVIKLKDLPFSRLTTLELGLERPYHSDPFFELLRNNPTLEALILRQSVTSDDFSEAGEPIHLPLLRRIELSGCGPFDVILRCVMTPKLSVFQFKARYDKRDVTSCIKAVLSQGISGIHQFYLHDCMVSFPHLHSFLQSSTCLSHLTLSNLSLSNLSLFHEGSINPVVEALCEAASELGVDGPPSSILCPKLQYLDLSTSRWCLKVASLMSLVKMRRNPPVAPVNETPCTAVQANQSQNRPLPILYLNIDDCDNFTPDDLAWFRDVVPLVSSDTTPRKHVVSGF